LLVPDGIGRGMVYYLPWQDHQGATLFEKEGAAALLPELSSIPPELSLLPPELSLLPPEQSTAYLEWSQLGADLQQALISLALPVSQRKRVDPELLRKTILNLCKGRYLGRRVLAQLLNRNPDDLLKRVLYSLIEEKRLIPAFPANDPRQAYTTNPSALKEQE